MNNIEIHIPELRFPGFTGSWEQRKFTTVFEGLQNNTLSRAELNYESGTVKNVHYGDVLIKFGDYIDASVTELPYISDDAKADKFKNALLQDGDIVIADTAEDDTVGKCTEIQGSEGLKLLSGLHTIACRPREEYGPKFLGYYINSPAYHSQLKPLMQGIKVTSISKSALQDTDMIMPKSVEEQTKIGEFFSKLDNLITLHHCRCESIKKYKNGMLQKMFPQNGERYPEIRFPGFTDPWEQRKLCDVTDEFQSGKFIAAADIKPEGEYPVFGGNGLRGYCDTYNHDGEFAIIGRQGALCGNMNYSCGKAYFTEHAVAVKANDSSNTRFLYYLLDKMNLGQYSDQSAQPGLAVGRLVKIESMFPSKEEQNVIGAFLTKIDETITLHQRKPFVLLI